jgi:TonB family protein
LEWRDWGNDPQFNNRTHPEQTETREAVDWGLESSTMFRRSTAIFCVLLIPSLLSADATLTYKVDTKLSAALPATLTQALSSSHIMTAPADRKIVIKGGKFYANTTMMDIIADLPNDKLTLLDNATRHYATIPVSQYADQLSASIPKLPAAAQTMMAAMKLTTDSHVTGRTAVIQGIQAEEREIVLSLGIPLGANAPPSPVMKLVMQLWMAKPDEVAHNPALQEFVASGFQTIGGMNPIESIQKIMGQFPGIGDSLGSYMKEIISTHSVTVRMHADVFMPILAMLARGTTPGPGGNLDPTAAVMTMNEELVNVSTDPVPDSVFQIPEGYAAVPLADIMSGMMPKPPAGPVPAPVKPEIIGADPTASDTMHPSVIQQVPPVYTDEARAKKISGSVLLSVVVGTDGKAGDIQVVRSLDPGLDQRAIEAVQKWVFRPGMKNGAPVTVRAQIEVNFKLLDKPVPSN